MLVLNVLGAIVLLSFIMNEAVSAYRFLKIEGSYMLVFNALVLFHIITNKKNYHRGSSSSMIAMQTTLFSLWFYI